VFKAYVVAEEPAMQLEHEVKGAMEDWPEAQLTQPHNPAEAAMVPALHVVHTLLPRRA